MPRSSLGLRRPGGARASGPDGGPDGADAGRERDGRPRLEIPPEAEFNGELLRQVRESYGLSLQQVSERTRITRIHLENVEADRYEYLPATVYLRGILVNLARELRLDPARVSKSYLLVAQRAQGREPSAPIAEARDPGEQGTMTDEERTKAMRLARAIASDISLYNEQKIIKGIEQDNLFDVLKEELDEGRDLYKSRVSPEVFTITNFFDRAVVDIIVRGKGAREVEDLVAATPRRWERAHPTRARSRAPSTSFASGDARGVRVDPRSPRPSRS